MHKFFPIVVLLLCGLQSAALAHHGGKSKWEVSNPQFSVPARTINIQVNSGTWMSLDVSPDGRQIAFDFLGDIYLLPIEGGSATNISSGFHWDMQPRFSPDGKYIAFTSDRDGGDNLWVMDADGTNPRQITSEKFRLMNNPTWSPDGRHLAGRKHFTTARSLGTGEIWLYDLRGGKGIPVIERSSKAYQKEIGEPMFVPDGTGIYYTQDITSGDRFIYAQNTNQEIFRIRKVTLETGEIDDIAGGAGGAVRPSPSPDGKRLAFVKRIRARSRLMVMDLDTGEETMLVDELDQDMQEVWGVHGLYPNMDWTPDSKSVVFWSEGKIHRVDATSGTITEIPFTVTDTRTVYDAPRHAVDVAPDSFTTRMIRFATKHGGSGRVVFETLGKLYLIDRNGGPRRLTSDRGTFELFPTFSPDGQWIYFVAWNDKALGAIKRVSARGGRTQTLTDTAGHYRDLAISPDGERLVVRLGSGGFLLSPMYSTAPGIYTMSSDGGALTLVTKTGSQPHFGSDNDRVHLRRDHQEGSVTWSKLVSVKMDGTDARDLAKSHLATEFRVAPDDKHIAFVDNYQVHMAPLPRTGKMITLGPKAEALPIRQVSSIGGRYVRWSSNDTVHWSIGPTFKSAGLDQIYGEDYETPESGDSLGVSAASDKPKGVLALTNARVVTMDDQGIIEGATVIVEDNRIRAVGTDVQIPAEAKTLDLDGKTIVPGFIDIHAHGPYGQDSIIPEQNWSTMGHLALGVTTLHDPSHTASQVFAAAEYTQAGLIRGPRIFSTGEIVYGAKHPLFADIDNLDDALSHIRRLKAQGAISVKNYNQPRREQRQQVVEAARLEKMMVVAEGGGLYHMDMNLVADGNTGIEHTLPQLAIYDDVVEFWRQTNVGYTPTLVVGYGTIWGEDYWYQKDEVWKHPILSRYVPPRRLQARSVRRIKAPDEDHLQAANAAIGKQLADAGVSVHTGAHGQREGLGTHWEMWLFVQGGMTPLEAIKAATIAPAQYMGFDKDLGSITPGKLADLVIIDGDITKDISLSDYVTHVMINGRLHDSATLNEVETGDHVTAPFYWRDLPGADIR